MWPRPGTGMRTADRGQRGWALTIQSMLGSGDLGGLALFVEFDEMP